MDESKVTFVPAKLRGSGMLNSGPTADGWSDRSACTPEAQNSRIEVTVTFEPSGGHSVRLCAGWGKRVGSVDTGGESR